MDLSNDELKSAIVFNIMSQKLERKRIENAHESLKNLAEQFKQFEEELEKRTDGLVRGI